MFVVFRKLGRFLKQALRLVDALVSDDVLKMALDWARNAATQQLTNDARREFVVKLLVARGIPESIARLATELAVQLLKRERRKTHV